MEQYEAMMDSGQLPPIPTSNHNALTNYQGGPITFPQFPDSDNNPMTNSAAYGGLPPGMTVTGSYPSTPTTPGAGSTPGGNSGGGGNASAASSLNLAGYNTPTPTPTPGAQPSHSQTSPYSGSGNTTSSFSMPYDPPSSISSMQVQQGGTHSSLPPMPTPPPPSIHSSSTTSHHQKPIYSCTYCGLVLSSNNALIEHKRIHTGERPYACQVCNKRFTQKAHLNIHKRIHTGEKPYACHICHKRFAQSSHLSSHKRIHTGEKPFVCGICHIGFTQKQRLDVHLKKHMDRPGQEIKPAMRRPPLVMANQGRMDPYRPGLPRDDSVNMMHMVGQGMPYIKQETGIGEMTSPNSAAANNHGLHHPGMDYKEDLVGREDNRDRQHHPNLGNGGHPMDMADKRRDSQHLEGTGSGDPNERNNQTGKNQNINAPSFSSEGMFLHPSGYVAYGGIEDDQEGPQQQQQSPRGGGGPNDLSAANPVGASIVGSQQQQDMNSPPASGHRRKSSFVRKRQSESPDKDGNSMESGENPEIVNGLHRFNALNQTPDNVHNNNAGMGTNGAGGEDDDEEDDEEENGTVEDYKDTGEVLDDKNDPPYHGNLHTPPRSINVGYNEHPGFRKVSVPVSNMGMIETRSQARRSSSGHEEMMNGGTVGMNPSQISYAGPANSYTNSGLVKVNNRISLVNFTADELLTHLMKRDDVHCCQFCCLIFQDAAMYHIHRNMHDKQDIRKCNMCGKMLLDKYDFTAHFLSMHQN